MAAARSQTSGPKGDINVTPLVDVVLVLLIIFMVITPMLQKGAEVKLPVVDNPEKSKDAAKEQVTISVTKDGRLYLETNAISEDALRAELATIYSVTPTRPIFVKGDVESNYGRVRAVMKMCNDAGFETVGLITKDRKEAG
jgi:biopolymer transport protein ExbD